MLITVPLAGELKFYPLNEEFRISFGAPVFLLLIAAAASARCLPGFLTGAAVFIFRVFLGLWGGDMMDWLQFCMTKRLAFSFI